VTGAGRAESSIGQGRREFAGSSAGHPGADFGRRVGATIGGRHSCRLEQTPITESRADTPRSPLVTRFSPGQVGFPFPCRNDLGRWFDDGSGRLAHSARPVVSGAPRTGVEHRVPPRSAPPTDISQRESGAIRSCSIVNQHSWCPGHQDSEGVRGTPVRGAPPGRQETNPPRRRLAQCKSRGLEQGIPPVPDDGGLGGLPTRPVVDFQRNRMAGRGTNPMVSCAGFPGARSFPERTEWRGAERTQW
jgi:hypothetical protein